MSTSFTGTEVTPCGGGGSDAMKMPTARLAFCTSSTLSSKASLMACEMHVPSIAYTRNKVDCSAEP